MKQETILTMSKMGCSGCIKNITRALETLPEVEVITTDLPTKTVHLRYDPEQTPLETIKTTLSTARYPVAGASPVDDKRQESIRV